MKFIKAIFITIFLLIILAVIGAYIFIKNFNINQYKPQIIAEISKNNTIASFDFCHHVSGHARHRVARRRDRHSVAGRDRLVMRHARRHQLGRPRRRWSMSRAFACHQRTWRPHGAWWHGAGDHRRQW